MPGELKGRIVNIEDEREANKVHNKGYPGIPQSGGSLKLGLLEAAFLVDEKGFTINGVENLVELFHYAGGMIPDFEVQYLVYRVLKLRGFFVKIPDDHFDEKPEVGSDTRKPTIAPFRLLPRGSRPSVPAVIHVLPLSEREEFSLARFHTFVQTCAKRGVEGMIGVVDEDGDVTFYSVKSSSPGGDCQVAGGRKIPGKLGQNRVLVPRGKGVDLLNQSGFFGQTIGSMLHLSLIEALYLVNKGKLEIEGFENWDKLMSRAGQEQPDIALRYHVYRQLRENGVRMKTGFKYGTHFRAYTADPDKSHADFLVHVLQDNGAIDWQEISRGIRVAHGVRKRILFTNPDMSKDGEFLELAWVRP